MLWRHIVNSFCLAERFTIFSYYFRDFSKIKFPILRSNTGVLFPTEWKIVQYCVLEDLLTLTYENNFYYVTGQNSIGRPIIEAI